MFPVAVFLWQTLPSARAPPPGPAPSPSDGAFRAESDRLDRGESSNTQSRVSLSVSSSEFPSGLLPPPRKSLRSGKRLRYSAATLIGTGGFAEVYLGLSHNTGELICVKQLSAGYQVSDVEHMEAGVAVLRELHHPNIVQVRRAGAGGGGVVARSRADPRRHGFLISRVIYSAPPPRNILSDPGIFCQTPEYFVRPRNILSDPGIFCQTPEYFVRPRNILSDPGIFCQTPEYFVRPRNILSDPGIFCQTPEYFVRPRNILSDPGIFCQTPDYFVRPRNICQTPDYFVRPRNILSDP